MSLAPRSAPAPFDRPLLTGGPAPALLDGLLWTGAWAFGPAGLDRLLLHWSGSFVVSHRLLWSHTGSFGATQAPLEPHRLLWSHTGSFGATRHRAWPVLLSWNHAGSCGTTQAPVEPRRLLWNHTGSCGTTRAPVEPRRLLWTAPRAPHCALRCLTCLIAPCGPHLIAPCGASRASLRDEASRASVRPAVRHAPHCALRTVPHAPHCASGASLLPHPCTPLSLSLPPSLSLSHLRPCARASGVWPLTSSSGALFQRSLCGSKGACVVPHPPTCVVVPAPRACGLPLP